MRVQADKAAVAGDNVVVADTADWDMVALEGRAYQVAEGTEKEKSRFIHSCLVKNALMVGEIPALPALLVRNSMKTRRPKFNNASLYKSNSLLSMSFTQNRCAAQQLTDWKGFMFVL